jgi:hypothetical protein
LPRAEAAGFLFAPLVFLEDEAASFLVATTSNAASALASKPWRSELFSGSIDGHTVRVGGARFMLPLRKVAQAQAEKRKLAIGFEA